MDTSTRGFHDLVHASASLNYSMRCRTIVDEVIKQHQRLADTGKPSAANAPRWGWLEEERAVAMMTPGAIAALVRERWQGDDPAPAATVDLRWWTWRRLGSPGGSQWNRGSESRSAWSLLMSPAPADEDELWALASSNDVDLVKLRALIA